MSAATIGIVLYVVGFFVTAGVLSAFWNDNVEGVSAGVLWPIVVPIYVVMLVTRHLVAVRRGQLERQRIERREQERLLREAGIE